MDKKILMAILLITAALVLLGCTQPITTDNGTQTNQNGDQTNNTPQETAPTPQPEPQPEPEPQQPLPDAEIRIQNNAYWPINITIQAGTKVIWTNWDTIPHTVTDDEGAYDSGLLSRGQSYSRTFDTPGTYNYHCAPHPYMKATIIVQ